VPAQPAAPRVRRRPTKHSSSGWATYKAKHPERAAFYASSTWRVMRDSYLKANPTCIVCGGRASHADHVISIALGGSQDGQLRSMCAKHHLEKTVRDSHEAAKRAAARRRLSTAGGVIPRP
jgi:5-methylcytosine-specific restriction endonuclease McrA